MDPRATSRFPHWLGQAMVAAFAVSFGAAAGAFVVLSAAHIDNPAVSAALEMTMTLLAMTSIAQLIRCFLWTRQRRDLMMLAAVVAVWLRDLPFVTAPAVAGLDRAVGGLDAQLALQSLVSVTFAGAAFASRAEVKASARTPLAVGTVVVIALGAVTEFVSSAQGAGPVIGVLSHTQMLAARDSVPALVAVCASSCLLLAAGFGFLRRRDERGATLFAVAAFTLALARLQFVALPEEAAGWVTFGDGLRLLAYAMLLCAAAQNYLGVRRAARELEHERFTRKLRATARAAAEGERHRLAQDLHDGLAQDLAVIVLHAQRLEAELGHDHALELAARHALAISRGTITDLSARGASMETVLRDLAEELSARHGARVTVTIESSWAGSEHDLDAFSREQLARIAREAITNALTHGVAGEAKILLGRAGEAIRMRVVDDGRGLAGSAPAAGRGFGVPMMRDRAHSLGGQLSIRSAQGGGTELEFVGPVPALAPGNQGPAVPAGTTQAGAVSRQLADVGVS